MSDPWSDNPIDLDGSRVINRRIYVDPDIFAAERDSIFAATWQWVAHETEMPAAGDYVTCTIAGRNIVVARDKAGRLNAFYNTCTHRGACLTERHKGNCGGKFVCMYHGWSFDTAGKLIGVSWADAYGEKFDRRLYDIPAIRLDTWGGNIFRLARWRHDIAGGVLGRGGRTHRAPDGPPRGARPGALAHRGQLEAMAREFP